MASGWRPGPGSESAAPSNATCGCPSPCRRTNWRWPSWHSGRPRTGWTPHPSCGVRSPRLPPSPSPERQLPESPGRCVTAGKRRLPRSFPAIWARNGKRELRVHPLQETAPRLGRGSGIAGAAEIVHRHAHGGTPRVAAEEPVEGVRCADAQEVLIREVHLARQPPHAVELHINRGARPCGTGAQCVTEAGEAVRCLGRRRGLDVGEPYGAAVEVLQVLAQRVQVELGVAAGAVVLLVPVFSEDAAVDIVEPGTAAVQRFQHVLQLVEPPLRPLHPGHKMVGVFLNGLDCRPLVRGEHPCRRSVGNGFPHPLGGAGQFGVLDDLEVPFVAHLSCSLPAVSLVAVEALVSLSAGCSATTSRCRRPRGDPPASWYLSTSRVTSTPSSSANAALSAAVRNVMSPSIAKVASFCRAAAAPTMSLPTSCTIRPASASSQKAEKRSANRPGSGDTAASADGEIR